MFSEFFAQEIYNVGTNIKDFFDALWDCLVNTRRDSKFVKAIQFVDTNEFMCNKFIEYLNTKAVSHDLDPTKEEKPVYAIFWSPVRTFSENPCAHIYFKLEISTAILLIKYIESMNF